MPPHEEKIFHETRSLSLKRLIEAVLCPQFCEMDVKYLLETIPISVIAMHGASLQVLKMLDISGFEVDGTTCPTGSLGDLNIIRASFPHLTDFCIGIDMGKSEVRLKVSV
jgi:hypothetical protein